MPILKEIVSNNYTAFLANRPRVVRFLFPCILVISLIIGAGYRSVVVKENYEIWNGLGVFFSLASNFQKTQGAYSFDEYLDINKNPDEYVYTKGKSKFEPTGSIENELGWSFILSFILKEGVKGFHNLALIIARYQIMIDLSIIIILFWVGKRIAGSVGACLAPLLYSIFKMPMVVMSWVTYYYWTIPFSALSLLFWAVIYRPEDKKIKIHWKYISFFLYGVFIGFATFVRLYFLLLPLFMAPLLFIREKSIKKGIILLLIILFGQSFFVIPQILITKKHFGRYALTNRGSWHLVVQGLGIYQNPWGIKDSGDLTVAAWAVERGGPDLNKDGMDAYNKFLGKEVFKMFKEHPEIFIRNFKNNMIGGMTISTHYFQFFGIVDTPSEVGKAFKVFPWMVLSSFILLYIFHREKFWIASAVFLQGLYLLLVVCTFFPSYIPFVASYIPVFVALLAIATAVHVKLFIALTEGGVRCWLNGAGLRGYPAMVIESYREDWSAGYNSVNLTEEQSNSINVSAPIKEAKEKFSSKFKTRKTFWGIFAGIFFIIIVASFLILSKKDPLDRKQLLSKAYVAWTLDDTVEGIIKDSKGKHDAISVNTDIIKGPWGNARHFNGRDSYIKTPVSFSGWKAFMISLWVRPEKKDKDGLSVILDNGHDANNNFVVQSADINSPNSEKWVLHFNGKDILLNIPFEQWTHLVIVVDAEKGYVKAYTGGKEAGIVEMGRFELGNTPLTFGKLAKNDDRYFKGTIEEIIILNDVVEN